MKIYIIFLLVLVTSKGYAQSPQMDSLNQALTSANSDPKKLEILKALTSEASNYDLNNSNIYAKKGLALAEKTDNKEWIPKFSEMTGRNHANMLHLDSATLYFTKALEGYKEVGNKKGEATVSFKIAWVCKRRGAYEEGMKSDLSAMKLMEEIKDLPGICDAYTRVADDLTRQNRMKEAMEYIEKAIDLCDKNNLTGEIFNVLFNAGNVYLNGGNPAKALEYYTRAAEVAKARNFRAAEFSDISNARGNALKRLGRYQEALVKYQEGLRLAKEVNYQNAIAPCIANIGEVNMLLGNYKEALVYQLETIRLMERDGENSNIVENYLHLSTTYEKLNNFKSALAYHRKALAMKDSIASVESDAARSKLLTQYESEKKEATIAAQAVQISQHKTVQWLGAGIVLLLCGFIVFGIITTRARAKTSKLLFAKNEENVLLLKEIHHRVKNNLEVVSSLLALQSAQIDDPSTKEAMLEGQNRVNSIGIVHQKLYQGENLGSIEMKEYFLNLSENILDSFGAEGRIKVELAMSKLDTDIDTAVPLGLIVNELLTNTLKYAFPDGKSGKVSIKLEKLPNGILHMEVADNGAGKSGVTKGTGFGTQLISLLTKQLNGIMREESSGGTNVIFDFKVSA